MLKRIEWFVNTALVIGLGLLFSMPPVYAQNFGNINPDYLIGNPTTNKAPAVPMPANLVRQTVPDNPTLIASPTTAFPGGVWRLTFSNNVEAEPLFFRPVNTACSLNSGNGDGGSQVKSADNKCWLSNTRELALTQFGGDPDNVIDSTTAVQAWGNWASGAEGRCGTMPAGKFKITAAIVWTGGKNWCLKGAGRYASMLMYSGTNTNLNIVSISDAIQITLEGWSIDSTTTLISGTAAYFYDVNYSSFIDFTVGQPGKLNNGDPTPTPKLYDGIWFDNTAFNQVRGSSPHATHDAIHVNQGVELNLDDVVIINLGNTGIHLAGGFGGLYLGYVSVECSSTGQFGLLVDNASTATTNLQIFLSEYSVFDTCVQAGIKIDDGTVGVGVGTRMLHIGGWASGTSGGGNPGVDIKNWTNGVVKVSGSAFLLNNQGSGLRIQDAAAYVSIDPAATINGNAGFGVECTVATRNVISDTLLDLVSWKNILGDYSGNCIDNGGQITRSKWADFTPTISCLGTGSPPTTSTAAGTYRRYGKTVRVQYDMVLNSTGTCANGIEFSLPSNVTLISGCPFTGLENNNKIGVIGLSVGSPSTVLLLKYDGSPFQTSGNRFLFTGECQASNY